jgi:hypothetical protein
VVIELLGSEVDKEVTIPRIIQSDVKEMFVGEVCWKYGYSRDDADDQGCH